MAFPALGKYMIGYVVFRVYIANILLLLLLLTVSQVRCASAPVYSNQLIKFELLTQSIRQRGCQKIFAWKTLRDTSLFTLSIQPYYNITKSARQSKFKRRLTILFTSGILILHFKVIFYNEKRFRKGRYQRDLCLRALDTNSLSTKNARRNEVKYGRRRY